METHARDNIRVTIASVTVAAPDGERVVLADWFVLYLVMPVFVPILISSHAVAGEKEKRTLEPLLSSPVTPLDRSESR